MIKEKVSTSNTQIYLLYTGENHRKFSAKLLKLLLIIFEKTKTYFAKKGVEFGKSQMRTFNLIGANNTYTTLAMLLSDFYIYTIKLAIFQGSQKAVFIDRRELTGSLLERLEEAFSYVDLANRTSVEFEGLERIDKRSYPPEAIREALLNAIVHRDYNH